MTAFGTRIRNGNGSMRNMVYMSFLMDWRWLAFFVNSFNSISGVVQGLRESRRLEVMILDDLTVSTKESPKDAVCVRSSQLNVAVEPD